MVKIYNKDQGIGYAPLPKISPYSNIEKGNNITTSGLRQFLNPSFFTLRKNEWILPYKN